MKKDSAVSATEEISLSIRKQVLFMQSYIVDCLLLDYLVAELRFRRLFRMLFISESAAFSTSSGC